MCTERDCFRFETLHATTKQARRNMKYGFLLKASTEGCPSRCPVWLEHDVYIRLLNCGSFFSEVHTNTHTQKHTLKYIHAHTALSIDTISNSQNVFYLLHFKLVEYHMNTTQLSTPLLQQNSIGQITHTNGTKRFEVLEVSSNSLSWV